MTGPDPAVRKPNRAAAPGPRRRRRPMPPAPRTRWDDPVFLEGAPVELELLARRYGLAEASDILTGGVVR